MVTVTATIRIHEQGIDTAVELLAGLVAATRKEEGCIDYVLHRSTDEPGTFLFYENWLDLPALERHMQTPHFLHWRQEAAAILAAPPEVRLWHKQG